MRRSVSVSAWTRLGGAGCEDLWRSCPAPAPPRCTLLTVVSLGLLGELGLVDLVLPVCHVWAVLGWVAAHCSGHGAGWCWMVGRPLTAALHSTTASSATSQGPLQPPTPHLASEGPCTPPGHPQHLHLPPAPAATWPPDLALDKGATKT